MWLWEWISSVLQIGLLAVAFYYLLLFFRGTRGAQIFIGLVILITLLIISTRLLHWSEINWVLRQSSVGLALALLVIFQPEIRRALAELGRHQVFGTSGEERSVVDNLVKAVVQLAEQKTGALIAVERNIGTRAVQETGIALDAAVVKELLVNIFMPRTPLHDGGVVIGGNRILAAGCVFPLSQKEELQKQLGTRHRAALGLSEETDSVVVVVSEETGTVSVCYRGQLSRGLDGERLRRFLSALLVKEKKPESAWRRALAQLDLTPTGIARSERRKDKKEESRHA
jgi:diadenylate cyclase